MKHFIASFLTVIGFCVTTTLIGYGLGKRVANHYHEAIQQIGKDSSCVK
jgi:hypothetical protein